MILKTPYTLTCTVEMIQDDSQSLHSYEVVDMNT